MKMISTDIRKKQNFTPAKSLALSFLVLILVGTVLLCMPFSSEKKVNVIDALFTSTSATCVTGLVVYDTGTHWTLTGQIIILLLIQFGGLGIMTFSTLGAYIIAGKLNMRNRQMIEGSLGGKQIPNLGKLLLAIVAGTLIIEMTGASILTFSFLKQYPLFKSLYLGVFHSISAFCNAGFSLFSNNLENYQNNITVNITIMLLIVTGGIGFWVMFDCLHFFKSRSQKLGLHSKIVISTTMILILTGLIMLLFLEWNNTLNNMSFPNKVITAAFQSITARTAGFNTIKIETLTNSSLLILLLLMIIGASPGSCGGGIKTTTFAVLCAMIFSRLRDQRQVRLFKRGIPEHVVSKAIGITFFALFLLILVIIILLITENPGSSYIPVRTLFLEVIFESFSAFGTVGLSMGLTPLLSFAGKVLIILLMYIGRIGPLTITLAIASKRELRIRVSD